jgi:triosephosphate isomerase
MTTNAQSRVPLIAGNWKMNLDHLQAIAHVQKLAWTLDDAKFDFQQDEVLVLPPFTALRSIQTLIDSERYDLQLGAQDVSAELEGAYTGEISAAMLAKLEVKYVLVGHSERRTRYGESADLLSRKLQAAWAQQITPIFCVGETLEERSQFGPTATAVAQLREALRDSRLGNLVVAYEPVWAIGTGEVATAEQAQEVCSAIRAALAEIGSEIAAETRILYGGSVKSGNIAGFMAQSDIDGALVGGASLDSDEFSGIAQYRKHLVL